jgi:hypothetical protein
MTVNKLMLITSCGIVGSYYLFLRGLGKGFHVYADYSAGTEYITGLVIVLCMLAVAVVIGVFSLALYSLGIFGGYGSTMEGMKVVKKELF